MKRHQNTEIGLWQQLKHGDVKALGKLYDTFVDALFIYGSQFSTDKSLVMDAIHDLFLNLYKYRKNLADTDNVEFYLMRSLKNTVIRLAKHRNGNISLSDSSIELSPDKTFEDKLVAKEFQNERSYKLTMALSELSKTQRKSLYLRFTEGYSYEDIAKKMNISVQSARTNIYRAIKVLRQQMQSVFLLF